MKDSKQIAHSLRKLLDEAVIEKTNGRHKGFVSYKLTWHAIYQIIAISYLIFPLTLLIILSKMLSLSFPIYLFFIVVISMVSIAISPNRELLLAQKFNKIGMIEVDDETIPPIIDDFFELLKYHNINIKKSDFIIEESDVVLFNARNAYEIVSTMEKINC